ncbi:MAG: hypothetical protein KGZ73_05225 [Rhizobiales bacterium]|nr:hypothetical protein [Hyphomicrobiales bacterium]
MPDTPYSNREIDKRFEGIDEKLDLILTQTTRHNGRLSKIERALLLAFGLIVGIGLKELGPVLSLIL